MAAASSAGTGDTHQSTNPTSRHRRVLRAVGTGNDTGSAFILIDAWSCAEPIDAESALRTEAANFFSAADRDQQSRRPTLPRVRPPRRWARQLSAVRGCVAVLSSTAHPAAPVELTVACVHVPCGAAPADVFLPPHAAREAPYARPRHHELHGGGRRCANDTHPQL